ncbi:MAG: hypothetical protein A2X84_03045 [Desulfuromonadaceae bacterium GWC2_58_13]|nr:MAG: hypothetical protein A2X84_03045 [Desulfuromonadaceae bacterium GWC2_58_13]
MLFRLAFLMLVGLWLTLVPISVLGETVVQPVRCVEVVSTDNGGNPLSYPSALFYDAEADEIYVTSPLKNKLVLLTSDYFPYLSVGAGRGLNSVSSCFVKDGRLYACVGADRDDSRGRIVMLNGAFLPDGKIYFSGFEGADSFLPRKILVGDTGNIYVTGLTGAGVVVLDPAGNYLRTIEPRDEVLGVPELVSIIAMAVGNNGNLYLLSEGMGRIYVYDRNEKFLYKFGQKGGEAGKLARPRGIAVDDRNKRVYVVDYQRHTASAFSLTGDFLFEFGGMGQGRGWLNYPSDICLDGFGRLLIADTFNHRVQVFELVEGKARVEQPAVVPTPSDAGQIGEMEIVEPTPATATAVPWPAPKPEFVLQVAFAREPEDAGILLERLAAKEYAVFIYEVDKGEKGVWYKVLIGPFAERETAEAMAERLRVEEKLTAIVQKR